MKRPVCLVLGANGFVGSHLVDALVAQGDVQVRAFDRYSRPAQFAASKDVKIVKGDLVNGKDVLPALEGVDYLVHCFSATTPYSADNDPFADIDNLYRSVEIFQHCVDAGVRKVIFISSGGAVYGNVMESKRVDETDVPVPVSPYGICKLSIEYYLEYFHRKYDLDYVIYRLTNPYGPRQTTKHQQGVVAAFLENILQGKHITVLGDGSASRDYIYIEDAARMIAQTCMKRNQHRIYNIGSGQQMSIGEIVEAFQKTLQQDFEILYKEAPKTFLQKTNVSVERFKKEFGEPQMTAFHDGLAKTIQAAKEMA